MTIRSDWRKAWRFISIQSMSIAASIQVAWVSLPDDWKASVPKHTVSVITLICLAISTYGVMTKQKGLNDVDAG